MKITKQYIHENLLTKSGQLNGNKTKLLKETAEELYLIFHNTEEPKCTCGNETNFKNFTNGYYNFCSLKCSNNSKETQEKFRITMMETYGVEYAMQSKELQKTYKYSLLENHGVEHPMQSGLFSNSGYKHKPYTFPSGKIVQVQGYEPQLLDELILIYTEEDILTDRKDMPEFWYITEDNKKHRYFPDAYIPKDNTIYEVKSDWTLKQSKLNGIYESKMQSVVNAGYIYELKVY